MRRRSQCIPQTPLQQNTAGWLILLLAAPVCRLLVPQSGIKPASLVAQTVKRLPAMWETLVGLLGREDPLEKEIATHSSTLAWKIPWTGEPGKLWSMGSQRVGHD